MKMKKKIILMAIIVLSFLVASCASTKCPAYGEKQRYQKNY